MLIKFLQSTKNRGALATVFMLSLCFVYLVQQKTPQIATPQATPQATVNEPVAAQNNAASPSSAAVAPAIASVVQKAAVGKQPFLRKKAANSLAIAAPSRHLDIDAEADKDDDAEREAEEAEERRSVEGFAKAEFEMLKNPKTGQIPRDIRQKTVDAAKKVRSLQLPAELNENGAALRTLPTIGITPRGPNNYGGRTLAIGIDKRNSNIIMAGGASAGMFRSTDGGATWARVTPTGDIFSVTAIAQDPRSMQGDTWYCGSGENLGNSASGTGATYLGNGLWKSTDNGLTWLPLAGTRVNQYAFDNAFDFVQRIVVNPNNGDVLVAASETIQRSPAGGNANPWTKVLGNLDNGSPSDLIYNAIGNVFYAAINGANAQGGIYRSTDGIAWTPIRTSAELGNGPKRIVLSNVANTANILAFYETTTSPCATSKVGLQLYDATATTWTDHSSKISVCATGASNPKVIASQGGYNMCITTKPNDANLVYLGGTEIYRLNLATSEYDYIGGDQKSATPINLHVDNHYLTFDPNDNNTLWACNDGGMRKTDVTGPIAPGPTTGGYAWTDRNANYTTHQYYGSDISPVNGSTFLAGAAQDNAFTLQPTDATAKEVGPTVDGTTIGIISGTDFTTFNAIISWQNGAIARLTGANGTGEDIQPTGQAQAFVTYFHLDNDNPTHLYYPTNTKKLFRTRGADAIADGAIGSVTTAWQEITGVATTLLGNISQMATTRNTELANASYTASNAARTLYMGTNDGKVYRLSDPAFGAVGAVPVNITPIDADGHVSGIAVHPYKSKEILVSYSNYGVPSVWYTADASVATPTWVNVEGPAGSAVELASARSVGIVKAGSSDLYLVGTSTGMYGTVALNGATTVWEKIGAAEIAQSPIISMRLRASDNKMCLGTHGNGLFMLTFPMAVLPLDLLSFKANKVQTGVQLVWKSTNEVDFSHYNVQKSEDGKAFTFMQIVRANGTGGTYEAIDEKPNLGQNYYRLQMVDRDGKMKYSNIVNVSYDAKTKIAVYPNPSKESTITLDVTLGNDGDIAVEWTDIAGRSRLKNTYKLNSGANQVALDISSLESGVYFITTRNVKTNTTLETLRFVKQ